MDSVLFLKYAQESNIILIKISIKKSSFANLAF